MRPALLIPALLAGLSACAEFRPLRPDELDDRRDLVATAMEIPERERIVYAGSWNGIPAGEGRLRFERDGDVYRSDAVVETSGIVALLYGVTVEASAVSGAEDLLSRRWSYSSDTSEKTRRVRVRFNPEKGEVISVIRKDGEVETVQFSAKGTMDPLGTIYALRRADLAPGRSFRFDLFTERNIYRADALVTGRERVRVPAGEFDTIVVRADIRRLKDGHAPERGRGLAFWLTDDERRVPVRIDADTKIGRIHLKLESHEVGWPRILSGRGTP